MLSDTTPYHTLILGAISYSESGRLLQELAISFAARALLDGRDLVLGTQLRSELRLLRGAGELASDLQPGA